MKTTIIIDSLVLNLDCTHHTFNLAFIDTLPRSGSAYCFGDNCYLRLSSDRIEKYYHHSFDVWIGGKKVGNLNTDGRMPKQSDLIAFKFSNWVFYSAPGWYHYYEILNNSLGLYAKSINYLELAHDRNAELRKQLSKIYHCSTLDKLNEEAIYSPALSRIKFSLLGNGTMYVFGEARGKKGCGKQVVVYDKGEEIEASKKYYIALWHHANGLDTAQLIERIEARFTNKYLGKLQIGITDLLNPETLLRLFKMAVTNVFSFKDLRQKKYTKHRNEKATFIHLFDAEALTTAPPIQLKEVTLRDDSDNRNRSALKTAVNDYLKSGKPQTSEYIRQFVSEKQAPKGRTWLELITRYSNQYSGKPSPEVATRQAGILDVLKPSFVPLTPVLNNVGLVDDVTVPKQKAEELQDIFKAIYDAHASWASRRLAA